MDAGLINRVILLDLRKAFDTVDHEILLKKLKFFGVRDTALKWFTSYLSNREQYCKVGCATSSTRIIRCGVPQGSNLGPLLFLLYVNDLPNCLKQSSAEMYADDSILTASSNDLTMYRLQTILNSELNNINQWLVANKLTLNVDKTEYMIIGTRQKLNHLSHDKEVHICEKKLKQVTSKKVLGVTIDDQLSWEEQVDNISKKVSQGIGVLRRAKLFVKYDTLQILYSSLVQPYFEHCSLVWGNCCDSLKEKLQKLQNRAARVITGDSYDTRSKDILQKLNWKNLSERRQQKTIAYVSKAIAGNCPENISKKFEKSYSERYDLRNNNKFLSLPKPRTNSMVRTFGYAAAKIWNENNKLE